MHEALKRAIRRSFEAAAGRYDASAFLQQEVARRLDDHLEGMKIDPGLILDAGCGTGFGLSLLKARFPRARQLGLRSEERRVGKECRRLCRSRWSPYH
jgi:malonyl-CoA O-methyltransferase